MYEGICEALHREMDKIEKKLSDSKVNMSDQDLRDIDMISHALKSLETYKAMKGESEYGDSYARGRSRVTGRYMSRDSGDYYHDVPEGYNRRY